jgi:DNA-binding CsgD family transcriptional regulator
LPVADELSRLLILLYEGASTPERLQDFLNELAATVQAQGAAFREQSFDDHGKVLLTGSSLFITTGYSDEALRIYGEHFHTRDIYMQRLLERQRTADCGVGEAIVTKTEMLRSELYHDYMKRFDLATTMWAKLDAQPNYYAALTFNRSFGMVAFGQAELELITALIPHMRQAFRLLKTLRSLETTNSMLCQSLEEMEIAICMVRQDGSILRTTEGADRIFDAENGISLRNGRLKVSAANEQQRLDALIASACLTGVNRGLEKAVRVQARALDNTTIKTWTAQSGGAFLITREPPLRPLQVMVSPFCAGSLMNEPEAAALVQFSDPSALPRSRSTVLRALYRLTPTESRLADLLLQGLEVREAADRMSTTLETARCHLKRVMAKAGARRQTELMRLMLTLPGTSSLD